MMSNLISMVDYVLEAYDKIEDAYDSEQKMFEYAKFLKQPLELWMFVPCGEDGEVLEKTFFPTSMSFSEEADRHFNNYQQAQDRVLFEGFEISQEKFIHGTLHFYIQKGNRKIMWNFNNEWVLYPEYNTIEDLVPYNLKPRKWS